MNAFGAKGDQAGAAAEGITPEAYAEQQAEQRAQLGRIADAAVRAAGQAGGGYGAYGGELDMFLRRHGLSRHGQPQPDVPVVDPAHLSDAGRAHFAALSAQKHADRLQAIANDAIGYRRQLGQHVVDQFFADSGIPAPQQVNRVSLGGTVTWTTDGEIDRTALQEKLQAALNDIAGQEVNVGGARFSVERVYA